MKQVAVALALSVLLYAYALVMATSDDVLPWALKILMIALLTVAVFIYRRPFQHLFTSVGYQALGSRDRADADLSRARSGFRARTMDTATATLPGFGNYRVNRWARRNPDQADQAKFLAGRIADAMTPGAGAASAAAARGEGAGKDAQGAPDLAADGADGGTGRGRTGAGVSGSRAAVGRAGIGGGPGGEGRAEPPPLNLPRRQGPGGSGSGGDGGRAGPAGRAAGTAAGTGRSAPPRWQPGPYLPARPGGAGPGGSGAAQQRRAASSAREAEASARRAEASSRRAENAGRRAEGSAARSRQGESGARRPSSWVRPIRRDK
jgi:hypothetical protein